MILCFRNNFEDNFSRSEVHYLDTDKNSFCPNTCIRAYMYDFYGILVHALLNSKVACAKNRKTKVSRQEYLTFTFVERVSSFQIVNKSNIIFTTTGSKFVIWVHCYAKYWVWNKTMESTLNKQMFLSDILSNIFTKMQNRNVWNFYIFHRATKKIIDEFKIQIEQKVWSLGGS